MSDAFLDRLRDSIQVDIGKRGLCTASDQNLVNACPDDFAAACRSIAEHPAPGVAIVTGFFIPTATPPAGETDGPLGALFLARAFASLSIPVCLVTDDFCVRAIDAGLRECGLHDAVTLVTLPAPAKACEMNDDAYWNDFDQRKGLSSLSHLIAIERVGISHANDRCHTMRGRDITDFMSPAHRLFLRGERRGMRDEGRPASSPLVPRPWPLTIGIGDGGNEIGMGKVPWDVIKCNIPGGDLVACRVATDFLIVCGVSNWGAYALATGVAHARGRQLDAHLFDRAREQQILETMVKAGPLVDGVTAKPTATVDGLTWEQYANVLEACGRAASAEAPALPRER